MRPFCFIVCFFIQVYNGIVFIKLEGYMSQETVYIERVKVAERFKHNLNAKMELKGQMPGWTKLYNPFDSINPEEFKQMQEMWDKGFCIDLAGMKDGLVFSFLKSHPKVSVVASLLVGPGFANVGIGLFYPDLQAISLSKGKILEHIDKKISYEFRDRYKFIKKYFSQPEHQGVLPGGNINKESH